MEQMQYILTEYAMYIAAAWAGIMLIIMAVTLHRINKSIRLHKKATKELQEEIKEVRLQIELQEQNVENPQMAADTEKTVKEELDAKTENWTKEQETLVNAVLGEVFS